MYTILFSQLLKMLVYIAVGYFLAKIGLISAKNGAALSTLLLYVVLPCVILRPYLNIDRSRSGEVLLSLFVQLRLPQVVMDCIEGFAACNAPLAMVVLGISMASAPLGEMFRQIKFYGVSGVRLLLIPGLSILVLSLVPHAYNTMKLALLLAAAAPVGSNVVIYAQKWGADGEAGGQIVCLSTLLSMVTLPVVFLLASKIWGIG